MTYTFTYTILTHNFVEHEGDYVITNIDYRVDSSLNQIIIIAIYNILNKFK